MHVDFLKDLDEKEISCCTYIYDEESENCLTLLRNADRKTQQIAKNIIELKNNLSDLQNVRVTSAKG